MSVQGYQKKHGIVTNMNYDTVPTRSFFLKTDPALIYGVTSSDVDNFFSGGDFFEFNVKELLQYLPEREAEIVYLIYVKKKNQFDVGIILNLSQPTVSTKYNRALLKLRYLSLIHIVDLRQILAALPGIIPDELEILYNLFFTANKEFTAAKFSIFQSRVRYIFSKYCDMVLELEVDEPLKYANLVGLFHFLQRFMRLRVYTTKERVRHERRSDTGDTGPS